eukprot:3717962-Pleurochrysis_carterae.AAC.2
MQALSITTPPLLRHLILDHSVTATCSTQDAQTSLACAPHTPSTATRRPPACASTLVSPSRLLPVEEEVDDVLELHAREDADALGRHVSHGDVVRDVDALVAKGAQLVGRGAQRRQIVLAAVGARGEHALERVEDEEADRVVAVLVDRVRTVRRRRKLNLGDGARRHAGARRLVFLGARHQLIADGKQVLAREDDEPSLDHLLRRLEFDGAAAARAFEAGALAHEHTVQLLECIAKK